MNKRISEALLMLKAQQEAEKAGTREFTCPLCGGTALWWRSAWNGHLRCQCDSCQTSLMQ